MGNGSTKEAKERTITAKNIKNLVQINSKHFLKLRSSEVHENKEGVTYCDIEREDFKLNTEILRKFEKHNNFSREDD